MVSSQKGIDITFGLQTFPLLFGGGPGTFYPKIMKQTIVNSQVRGKLRTSNFLKRFEPVGLMCLYQFNGSAVLRIENHRLPLEEYDAPENCQVSEIRHNIRKRSFDEIKCFVVQQHASKTDETRRKASIIHGVIARTP